MSFGAEEASLVQEFSKAEAASEGAEVSYNKIPGFALRDGSKEIKDQTLAACKAKCTGEGSCRSISYRAKDKLCFWSVDSLNFDPDFVMKTKAKTSKEKKFRTYQGLTYRSTGWLKVEGQTEQQCEEKCAKSDVCQALSYRSKDMMCLLSPKSVSFAPDFVYYEKKGLVIKSMPLKKEGVAKAPKSEKKGAKPAAAAAEVKSNKNAVKALMTAEEAKLKLANGEISKSKEIEIKAKHEVGAEKDKVKKEIADAKAAADKKLKKDESKFTKDQAEKTTEKEQTMKLEFASAELKEKAGHKENKADREKQRTEKSAADVKKHAAREAARAVAEGAKEAADRVEKAKLDEMGNAAAKEMSDANEKKQKAASEEEGAKDKMASVKEKTQKKGQAAVKEITEKKGDLSNMSAEDKEKAVKEIEKARNAAMADGRKKTAEMSVKAEQRASERTKKSKIQGTAEEKKNKADLKSDGEREKKAEDARKAENKLVEEEQMKALKAKSAEAQVKAKG